MDEKLSVSLVGVVIYKMLNFVDNVITLGIRKIVRGAMVVFSWFVIPYSRLMTLSIKNQKIPPITNAILEIKAVKLAHMIRTGEITSEEVIKAYIDRCREVNPFLNAIVQDRFEEALKEARLVDQLIKSGEKSVEEMENSTPLLGLPITIKESIKVKGMINQGGRVFKQKQIAQFDAPSVKRVKDQGGIILLVSNTPELCLCWETYNKVSGLTKNPYDLKRTPGGSSGGEGALLGSGASLIGLSSDVAGSARLPAMFSGIYGHKPTPYAVCSYGHTPESDAQNWGDYFTIAPMTRYASDLPFLLKCIADPSGPRLSLDSPVDISNIKFYFMNNDGPSKTTRPLSRDVKKAIDDVASYFDAKKVQISGLKWSLEISTSSMLRIKGIETIYEKPIENQNKKPTLSGETFKYLLGQSNSIFPSVAVGYLQEFIKLIPEWRHKKIAKIAAGLKNDFRNLLGTNGVFLYPTFPTTAHRHYEIYHKLVDPGYMMIFNAIGLPVTNCMVRLDHKNLPIGIQVVANPGQDHLALAVAKEIEKHFGGWVPPS